MGRPYDVWGRLVRTFLFSAIRFQESGRCQKHIRRLPCSGEDGGCVLINYSEGRLMFGEKWDLERRSPSSPGVRANHEKERMEFSGLRLPLCGHYRMGQRMGYTSFTA